MRVMALRWTLDSSRSRAYMGIVCQNGQMIIGVLNRSFQTAVLCSPTAVVSISDRVGVGLLAVESRRVVRASYCARLGPVNFVGLRADHHSQRTPFAIADAADMGSRIGAVVLLDG